MADDGLWSDLEFLPPERVRLALAAFRRVAKSINAGLPLGDTLLALAEGLRDLFDLNWGSVSLLSDSNDRLETSSLSPDLSNRMDLEDLELYGSLMGWTVLVQRATLVEDVEAAEALPEREELLEAGMRSVAIVPVQFQDKIIGTLNLGSASPGGMTHADEAILDLAADILALAIGKARAAVVKRRQAGLTVLSEIGRIIQSTLELDPMLHEVLKLLRESFGAGYAAVSLLTTEGRTLELFAAAYGRDTRGPFPGSARVLPETLLCDLAEDADQVLIDDKRHAGKPLVSGFASQAIVPTRVGGTLAGVLELGRREPFTEDDRTLLHTVGDRLGGAVHAASLLDELMGKNQELSGARDELAILYEIGRVATSTLDVDRIVQPVSQMVCDSFGYDFAAVFLLREGDLELRAYGCRAEQQGAADAAVDEDLLRRRLEGRALVSDVIRLGETLIVSDASRGATAEPLSPESVSAVAIPLRVGETVSGVLTVESIRGDAFDLEDVRILETLADQLSSAIDNSRLYRELLAANAKQAKTFRELKIVQDDLMQATRLAALGEMSGRVAHEVLNPITGILARVQRGIKLVPSSERSGLKLVCKILDRWLEAFREGRFEEHLDEELAKKGGERYLRLMSEIVSRGAEVEAELREDLAFVEHHSNRIVKIVDSLRGLARQSQDRETGSVVPILREAVELLRDGCERRRIQLVESYREPMPDVCVDPSELVQVFSNVLRNAMQAVEARGGAGRILVEASHSGGPVEVRIRDTGIGIPMENVERLFSQAFTTKDRGSGTGLGLSIARRFLRGYGGEIELEWSEPGEGAVFLMTIPPVAD